jgi:hypothetical protein
MMVCFGDSISMRIANANMPAIKKKARTNPRYMIPIRL